MLTLGFFKTLKSQEKSLVGLRSGRKNSRGRIVHLLKQGSLPSTRISHLSMIMEESLLSMKETVSIGMVEVVVGSSLEFKLTKM